MEALVDFSREFDVGLLDRVVQAFYSAGGGQEQQTAKVVLSQFQEHPDAWSRVPDILERSSFPQSKFIGLQILEKLISTRWMILPPEQRQGVRNFVVSTTVTVASDEANLKREKVFINKLNLVLVQILKQEWPQNWPDFIPELVGSSRASLSLCENNMVILRLLSEEVFVFSADQMTQSKTSTLQGQLGSELTEIFTLSLEVLREAQKVSLIKATLETLLKFVEWIPKQYLFETDVIDLLLNRFLPAPEFRNLTLLCLAEIANIRVGPEHINRFAFLFTSVLHSIERMIPLSTDIASAYDSAAESGQQLITHLALFLTNWLSVHEGKGVSADDYNDAHEYLVKISKVDEREIFKVCLEYWATVTRSLYEEQRLNLNALVLGNEVVSFADEEEVGEKKDKRFNEIMSQLRYVMIEKMVKPEEVLVVENDEGEIVREHMKETDTIVLYKAMREVLVYLTHLDVRDTLRIMQFKLSKQKDGSEWSWQKLNTLCWAIGSISGTMNEQTEKLFLVEVIKELLSLVEQKRGKDNKAIIASNIMYIVGQYPRFLKGHWNFLRTVVLKLFEFMHEMHEGVQDMACDTFIKISHKCGRYFVIQHKESEPFISFILRSINMITNDLSAQQVHTFYEAVGYMIAAEKNEVRQKKLLEEFMALPNSAWDTLMAQAAASQDVLSNLEAVKLLSNVLKTNNAACKTIGDAFLPQLGRIFTDMMALYKAVSGKINTAIANMGPIASRTTEVRHLRAVKKDVLQLVMTQIRAAKDPEVIDQNVIPPLLDAILVDYNTNIPEAREAEVLRLMCVIVTKLGNLISNQMEAIFGAVFGCTLEMITKDFIEFPEHRTYFFTFLRAVNLCCFPALLYLNEGQRELYMNSIFWGMKHTVRDVAEIALSHCLEVMLKFNEAGYEVSLPFLSEFFLRVVQETFGVLTDSDHKSGFSIQARILAFAFYIVEEGALSQRARLDTSTPATGMTVQLNPQIEDNSVALRQYVQELLSTAFPHIQPAAIQNLVEGLQTKYSDDNVKGFKSVLRDFLVEMKEFSNASGEDGDNAELYREDREREAKEKEAVKNQVPGMLKPDQVEETQVEEDPTAVREV